VFVCSLGIIPTLDVVLKDPSFGSFGTEWHVPSVFWFVGGTDPNIYGEAKKAGRVNELPVNHSPRFAPVIHPTLQTGVETLVVAAQVWLSAQRPLH
jgi:hippurate hydrolase